MKRRITRPHPLRGFRALVFAGVLALAHNTPAMPQQLSATVTMRDGQVVAGVLPADTLAFAALTPAGEAVNVSIVRPPEWSALRVACDIDWDAGRRVFVVRNFGWTGELMRIWDTVTLLGPAGKRFAVSGARVKQARFEYKTATPRRP